VDHESVTGTAMFVRKRLQVPDVSRGWRVAPFHFNRQTSAVARQHPVDTGSVGVTPEPHAQLRLHRAVELDEFESLVPVGDY
jgi:hypothetical protein